MTTVPGFSFSASPIVSGAANSIGLSTIAPNDVPSIATRTRYFPGAYARRSSVVPSIVMLASFVCPGGTSSWRLTGIGRCIVSDDQTGESLRITSMRNRSAVGKSSRTTLPVVLLSAIATTNGESKSSASRCSVTSQTIGASCAGRGEGVAAAAATTATNSARVIGPRARRVRGARRCTSRFVALPFR